MYSTSCTVEPHHLFLAYYLLLNRTGQDRTVDCPTAVKQLIEQLCMQYINSDTWSFDNVRIAAYCMIICSSTAVAIAVVAASLPFSLPMKNSPKVPEAVTASVLKRNSRSVFHIYKCCRRNAGFLPSNTNSADAFLSNNIERKKAPPVV